LARFSILVMSLFYDLLSRAEKNRAQQAGQSDLSRRTHVSARLLTTVPAVTVACTAFLIGYYWRAARANLSAPQDADAAQLFPSARIRLRRLTQMPAPAKYAPEISGFVFQVAAMEKETNADALCEALRREDFSAFVFSSGPTASTESQSAPSHKSPLPKSAISSKPKVSSRL
jgi:hypothetical protein